MIYLQHITALDICS